MTGEEYFKFLCSIKTVSKVEWVVKGDPWDSDVCKVRVYTDKTIFYKGIMPSETGFRFSSGL